MTPGELQLSWGLQWGRGRGSGVGVTPLTALGDSGVVTVELETAGAGGEGEGQGVGHPLQPGVTLGGLRWWEEGEGQGVRVTPLTVPADTVQEAASRTMD